MGGRKLSQAIINLITKETKKEDHQEIYRTYPSTTPKGGFEQFHASTVEPIFCEIPEESKVLDIGCNSGELIRMLKEHKNCDVYGIDLSETALAEAKEKGLNVIYGDAENLPFPDHSFDAVILREVISHIFDPRKALKEINRVLKKDGFLVGSTPHANLERVVWEERRLHHRYYDENGLLGELEAVFNKNYLRVLKGGQFSMGFASSMLAHEPVEMLFKSGNGDIKPWEYELLNDKKTIRVWMGPTQWNADAYYRMIGYAIKLRQKKGFEIGFDSFSWKKTADGCARWEELIRMNSDFQPQSSYALNELEKCLKVANTWIFQLTHYEDVLSFFEISKKVYPDKKFVTECDDWVFDIPGYNIASHPYRPGSKSEKISYEQINLSDAVIVSTNYLKNGLLKYFPEKKIYTIPNTIDFDLWDNCLPEENEEMAKKADGIVRIAYTGAANHDGDLQKIKPVIQQILNDFENVEILCAQEFECLKEIHNPRLKILKQFRNIIDYPSMLKSWKIDIGIAPLRDNEFNRAKSNLRWLEYSALKVPTVMSNVQPFSECVIDGEDGFLATNKTVWYETLKKLIQDEEFRKKIGNNSYARVKKDFNMDKVANKYGDVLKELQNGR